MLIPGLEERIAVVWSLEVVSDSFVTSWTVATHCQASLSMKFSKQDYCCGLPFPSSKGTFSTQGLNPTSPVLVDEFFTIGPPWKVKESTGLLK